MFQVGRDNADTDRGACDYIFSKPNACAYQHSRARRNTPVYVDHTRANDYARANSRARPVNGYAGADIYTTRYGYARANSYAKASIPACANTSDIQRTVHRA